MCQDEVISKFYLSISYLKQTNHKKNQSMKLLKEKQLSFLSHYVFLEKCRRNVPVFIPRSSSPVGNTHLPYTKTSL